MKRSKNSVQLLAENTMNNDYSLFSERLDLSCLRKELGMSQTDMARLIGVSQPAISDFENKTAMVKLATLKRFIEALGGNLSLSVEFSNGKKKIYRL